MRGRRLELPAPTFRAARRATDALALLSSIGMVLRQTPSPVTRQNLARLRPTFSIGILLTAALVSCLHLSCSHVRSASPGGTPARSVARPDSLHFQHVLSFGSPGSGPGQFSNPRGISVDTRGTVYVADTGNDRIQRFDADGRLLGVAGRFGRGDGEFNRPTDVCAAGNFRIQALDSQNKRVLAYSPSLDFVAASPIISSAGSLFTAPSPASLCLSDDGSLFVTDRDGDRVLRRRPGEQEFSELEAVGGILHQPTGIAADEDGSIYICDTGADRVVVVDGITGAMRSLGEDVLARPEGVDCGRRGMVFVADTGHDRVVVFGRSGDVVGEVGGPGEEKGQFDRPGDVAVYRDAALYVLDSNHGRVQKFEIVW